MTPLGIVAILGAILSMLAYGARKGHSSRSKIQFVVALATWGLLWFATGSTFARDGMMNLPDHMVGHVIVMFVVPMGLVGSASGRSFWWVMSASSRRRLLRWWYIGRRRHVSTLLANPIVAALVLNIVMVSAHLPVVFDWVMERTWVMDWVMEPAFLLSGLFFFHYLVPAVPRKIRVRLRLQLLMVVVTMLEMLVMAMSMSIFTKAAWYSVMYGQPRPMAGMTMTGPVITVAQAFHQQQLAAAILWICGDFWAVPCLVLITRRLITRDGSLFAALEGQSARLSGSAP